MKIQSYFLILIISTFISLPLHGRHKGAVTQDKVTGSIIDLVRERDNMKEERDKLKMENDLLRSVSSSSWLLVNDSDAEVQLSRDGTVLIEAAAKTVKEDAVKTGSPLKAGDRMKIKLGGSKSIKLKLEPGETKSYKSKSGKSVAVTIDFLTGSRVWMLLVRPE